ncbi:hypothetical protein NQ315_001357 [Exocentrus adspersus]|uniref:Fibronectin type-III domain-containing protein n=1 Tax=Exocentrus adspersus TaxID=1586481 RepID=A0AAV8WF15_9CUCU|nr:hypothetical protein NQ315_001357 [Exocentrus adspersus]
MEWDLKNRTLGDCSVIYQVTLHDKSRDTIEDVYVAETPIVLKNTSPYTRSSLGPSLRQSQDNCVPKSVHSIDILSNTTLAWEVDTFEICDLTNFNVDIWGGDADEEYHYNTTDTCLDISFLNTCEVWNFTITPVSYGVAGVASTLRTYVPLPPDANLSLAFIRYTLQNGALAMEWNLANRTLGDCSVKYRLTIHDRSQDTIDDLYLRNTSIVLSSTTPCTWYAIVLRAVNMAYPLIEGPESTTMNYQRTPRAQNAPTLKAVDIRATSFNLTVALEGDRNRCPLRTLLVDGGSYFNASTSLQGLDVPEVASVEVKSLLPNTMYFFNVSVQNSAGWSAGTRLAVQTLNLSPD